MLFEELFLDKLVVHMQDKRYIATTREILMDPINEYGMEYREKNVREDLCAAH
jgi:hypothetical protein